MSSCNNSSNLLGNVNINYITHSGARLMMTHPLSGFSGGIINRLGSEDGITAGDVIRFDTHPTSVSEGKYVRAKADFAHTSEVIGIVEGVDDVRSDGTAPENAIVNVVLSGQIKFPTDRLLDTTPEGYITGASGGNDVYFLSSDTAGAIQNVAPTTPTHIAKPILQKAADGDFNAHVVNYIGYQIGGEIVGSDPVDDPEGQFSILLGFDDSTSSEGRVTGAEDWFNLSDRNIYLPINTDDMHYTKGSPTYYTSYLGVMGEGLKFGYRMRLVVNETLTASDNGRQLSKKGNDGISVWDSKIVYMERNTNVLYVQTTSNHRAIVAGDTLQGRMGTYTVASAYPTAMVLPYVQGKVAQRSFLNLDGKRVTTTETPAMYIARDTSPVAQGQSAPGTRAVVVSIPTEIRAEKLIVKKELIVESSSNKLKAVDLANIIKVHDDQIKAIQDVLSLNNTAIDITNI